MITGINSEDRLVQKTFADHLEQVLGWDSVYAWNQETFGPDGTLGRKDTKEAVLSRDLRAALKRLNPDLPDKAIDEAVRALTVFDVSRSMLQHNRDFYRLIRDLLAAIKARLADLDRFWEKEQTKAEIEVFTGRCSLVRRRGSWLVRVGSDIGRLAVRVLA